MPHTVRIKIYNPSGKFLGVKTMPNTDMVPFHGQKIFASIATEVKPENYSGFSHNFWSDFGAHDREPEYKVRDLYVRVHGFTRDINRNEYIVIAHSDE